MIYAQELYTAQASVTTAGAPVNLPNVAIFQKEQSVVVKAKATNTGYISVLPDVGSELVYLPTLSELIEACGNAFDEVGRLGEHWEALAGSAHSECNTPEGAIARLWLALQTDKRTAKN